MTNSTADQLFAEYGAYHTDPRNRVCHEIGIPLIVLAIQALVDALPAGPFITALLTIALAAYYVRLVGLRALPTILALSVAAAIASFIAWPWAIALFLVGWIFQFVGHAYEGKKPAFLTNLVHLLVGPLWIGHILTTPRSSSSAR
jgi:uncharacterized membrane protein YGL010W